MISIPENQLPEVPRLYLRKSVGELEKCWEELSEKRIRTTGRSSQMVVKHLGGERRELYKAAIDSANEDIQVRIREDGREHHS